MRLSTAVLSFTLLLAIGGGGAVWMHQRRTAHEAERILLLDPDNGVGFDESAAQSFGTLLMDELEIRGDAAVTQAPSLPEPFQPRGDLLVLRPHISREGADLHLTLDWARMGPGHAGTWVTLQSRSGNPTAVIEATLARLPQKLRPADPVLLPSDAVAFWNLEQADSVIYSNVDLDGALTLAQHLVERNPNCAEAQLTLAHLNLVHLLQDPTPFTGHEAAVGEGCDRATALIPGYPRALRYACRLLSDEGRQAEALRRLQTALRQRPRDTELLAAVDYAARTAGLLDLALAARARMETLWSGSPLHVPNGFTYLYAGRFEAFEASISAPPNVPRDGFTRFNLGYAALMRGHRDEASLEFQAVEQDTTAEAQFRALAKAFRFQLEDRSPEARVALDQLERSRVGLQVPDGEFTFTMGEAAAFIGEPGLAMDLAQQASGQGFICTAWYRASPFMAALQSLPRWRSLLQHVEERRARLAQSFQPSDFGL